MKLVLNTAFMFSLIVLHLVSAEAKQPDENSSLGWMLTSDYSLEEPFNPDELRHLAENPTRDDRRMMVLLLRAGIEKDKSFQVLLKKPELRHSKNVALALSAYDYMINRNESALDHILAELATEDIGADSDAIVVLQTLDEWDRSIRAFRKHFIHADGAGAHCKVGFITTRAHLYPEKFAAMREAIEAPNIWPSSLLPKK